MATSAVESGGAMDAARWQRVRAVFDDAVELDESARAAFIAAHCGDDATLAAEVRSLLDADRDDDDAVLALEARAPDLIDAYAHEEGPAEDDWSGRRIGAYEVDAEVGRGGMGAVYRAHRVDGQFEGDVAIKRIRAGLAAADMRTRFASERRLLASLDHPNIARLLDAGATADGEPYLVLEFVDGVPLGEYADRHALTIEARVRLFVEVCDAVAHAHDRLIVHRDLKPTNVLVTRDARVKLLDFGVAKLVAGPGDEADVTRTMLRLFTPEYAAPEQIRGDVITTAVDVYALGLLLFELLTGERPYRTTSGHARAIEHAVLEQEPQRPSQAISRRGAEPAERAARAGTRASNPAALRRALRGDLDAIVMKALRKEPRERYASVRMLAADAQRHLDRRPVEARHGDLRYRAGRYVRRHALVLSLVAGVVLALAAGLGIALWQAAEAREQRDVARAEAAKSRQLGDLLVDVFTAADPAAAQGEELTARELLEAGVTRMQGALADQPLARAELLGAIGQAQVAIGQHERGLVQLDEAVALTRDADADARTTAQAHARRAIAWQALGRYAEVLADLEPLRAALPRDTVEDRLLAATLDERIALAAQATGDHARADVAYRAAIESRSAVLGATAPETAETELRYVSLLTLRGKHELARDTAAPIVERLAGSGNDPLRAQALGQLAMAEANLGNAERAEALRRESLALFRAAYGDDHPETTGAENDLASTVFNRKKYAEALAMFERVLEKRRREYRADHPAIATVATNVAWSYYMTGRPAEAEKHARVAYEIRRAAYGDAHVSTALALRALAAPEIELGKLEEAQAHLRAGVAAHEASLGPQSKVLAGTLSDLARVLVMQREADPGCATARRAARLLGPNDPNAAFQELLVAACEAQDGDVSASRRFADLASQLDAAGEPAVMRKVEQLRTALR